MRAQSEPPPAANDVAVVHSLRPGASSWTSLVAATALGLEAPRHLRVRVSLPNSSAPSRDVLAREYQLIVQMYETSRPAGSGGMLGTRPVGCAERLLRMSELRVGVDLDVVQFAAAAAGSCRIVAWLRPASDDLDDHMWTRPSDVEWIASATWEGREPVQLVLIQQDFDPAAQFVEQP